MSLFGKRTKHRKFDFIPRFYDPDKEKMEERMKKYGNEKIDDSELMKQRIKSGFKTRGRKVDPEFRSKQVKKSNLILLSVLAILIFLSYIFIVDYLPRIIEVFDTGNTN